MIKVAENCRLKKLLQYFMRDEITGSLAEIIEYRCFSFKIFNRQKIIYASASNLCFQLQC